ncbi:MAG: ATPase, T2SS/T4P/T4SS family [Planctomycetia bacterium]|nr:ATPase, T2SS/T4P/T4SS family [Planctomycetia bacterium]
MAETSQTLQDSFALWVAQARAAKDDFIVLMIQRILQEASIRHASDVHFQPGRLGIDVRIRLDGVLHRVGILPLSSAPQVAARIKVLANLMTYKTTDPQEGRVRKGQIPFVDRDIRISTAPSLYGERIVARFFSEGNKFLLPLELGFSNDILRELSLAVQKTSGAILITGPAGNGKTTTACALLRALVNQESPETNIVRSIISLEDPIEHAIDGVAQMEVSRDGETTLDRLIRYLMRQDPDVIMVGEIRDRATAEAALQAALTGHLLISTFHASDAAGALCRLLELGIEPFTIRSSVSHILCQRLVRHLCSCAVKQTSQKSIEILGETFRINYWYEAKGCPNCHGTGYSGRFLVAESLPLGSDDMANAILERRETSQLLRIGKENGMITLAESAVKLIEEGKTSPIEILRVLGG